MKMMKKKSMAKKMKTMKKRAMKKSVVGKKASVFRGTKMRTRGGLKREQLMKNKRGKVVSKKASANGSRRYKNIQDWVEAVVEARAELRVSGFVAINGKSLQGKALFVKAKAIRAKSSA